MNQSNYLGVPKLYYLYYWVLGDMPLVVPHSGPSRCPQRYWLQPQCSPETIVDQRGFTYGVLHKCGYPQIDCFIVENPIWMDDLGVPPFPETPKKALGPVDILGQADVETPHIAAAPRVAGTGPPRDHRNPFQRPRLHGQRAAQQSGFPMDGGGGFGWPIEKDAKMRRGISQNRARHLRESSSPLFDVHKNIIELRYKLRYIPSPDIAPWAGSSDLGI